MFLLAVQPEPQGAGGGEQGSGNIGTHHFGGTDRGVTPFPDHFAVEQGFEFGLFAADQRAEEETGVPMWREVVGDGVLEIGLRRHRAAFGGTVAREVAHRRAGRRRCFERDEIDQIVDVQDVAAGEYPRHAGLEIGVDDRAAGGRIDGDAERNGEFVLRQQPDREEERVAVDAELLFQKRNTIPERGDVDRFDPFAAGVAALQIARTVLCSTPLRSAMPPG